MAHLFIAITAHGYGHLSQVAPVVHALRARLPKLRITLQGNLNPAVLHYRLPADVLRIPQPADVALPMDGPLKVRWDEGLRLYQTFEDNYERHLKQQIALLEDSQPDLLLADIPWLPLDAARRLGIPAVGLCSLNWLDILRQSPVGQRLPTPLRERMRRAYAEADLFIRPAPSMPMPWLDNSISVGPIAELRERKPQHLRTQLKLKPDCRLILMQFGGTGSLALDPAPLLRERLHILTADPSVPTSPAVSHICGNSGIGMLEALASCDAMITKPGYGSFAEAACHGIPVLYVPRDDWPETQALTDWIPQQVPTAVIAPERLACGDITQTLAALLEQVATTPTNPIAPTGVTETRDHLLPWL
jgi:UDP:flavonoid glycosyltransferase YjiC (YdhE family)